MHRFVKSTALLASFLSLTAAVIPGCADDDLGPLTASESEELTLDPGLLGVLLPKPLIARHGMTSAQYQAAFDEYVAQGYRLTHISAYNVGGTPRFAAIWEKISGPAWVARHGMTSAEYQSNFDTFTSQGYRLIVVEGYEQGGQARYAAIWDKSTGPAWVARHGMTSAQYQAQFNTLTAQGYRPTKVQGYGVGGVDHYAAIFEQASGPAWMARHGLTSAQYQSAFDTFVAQGYRLKHVSAYQVTGGERYAAIWEKTSGPAWVARHALSSHGYQHEFSDRALQGYRLKQVDGSPSGLSDRYAAIWEAEPTAKTGNYCKSSQCFSLQTLADQIASAIDPSMTKWGFEVRRGLSVIQRADGPGRTSADSPQTSFSVHDRFNPASVSKTITSVATLQLLEQRGIPVSTPIHSYLPASWNIPANNKTITFAEVLNHSSGLRNEDAGNDYLFANVKQVMEHSISMADKVPAYANINYALLRVLVASLDGYTDWSNGDGSAARFITYVNGKIFAPIGIYDVQYKASGAAPTLFYPNPPGSANGTSYGDWTLKPGSAGGHNSIHELADFAAATFGGTLLSSTKLGELKAQGLGFGDYGTFADGTRCFGKGGYFPGSWNGGAELNTVLISCDNGVTAMVMINGQMSPKTVFENAMNKAFTAQ